LIGQTIMYERYYGFAEKPFSLTPDPKYLFRSPSHAGAFELLQYAVARREGFALVTGDIGTGKTTICRALLERIDRSTYTALVLNPFLSEDDLLRRILQDFGVVAREELRRGGRLDGAGKEELVELLHEFLLGLAETNASALLVIDEAQNLPPPVLEQIRILSNLETDKDKLLQIVLVGQLNLKEVLGAPGMRQLDQRVSIRCELTPLDADGVAAYVAHRLAIAGAGGAAVTFSSKATALVHRLSGGVPRLINLICDRALVAGFSSQSSRITPELVADAARSLDIAVPAALWRLRPRAALAGTAASVVLGLGVAAGLTTDVYLRHVSGLTPLSSPTAAAPRTSDAARAPGGGAPSGPSSRTLPTTAAVTILTGSYSLGNPDSARSIQALTDWLESSGFDVYYAEVDLGSRGRWRRVLAGAYTDAEEARRQAARLNEAAPRLDAVVVTAPFATGANSTT
jgi:general secretion pathway protein A